MALSEADKQILFKGCFYPEYYEITKYLKTIHEATKEFATEEVNKQMEYYFSLVEAENGYFTLFENIYLPNFTAKTAAEQKLILASAKQRVVVADVADKVYEDFLSLYLPAEKQQLKQTLN